MTKFLLPFLVLTLVGCATSPTELRKTVPYLSGQSDKTSQAYMACVLEGWNERNLMSPISSQPLPNGYTTQITDMARGVVMLLDVRDNATGGSSYTFYKKRDMSYYENIINNCK